jgi:GNAT superfamily N-acetyltransferase
MVAAAVWTECTKLQLEENSKAPENSGALLFYGGFKGGLLVMGQFGPSSAQLLETIPSMPQDRSMPISFRQARDPDFSYCKGLYFQEMEWIIEELHLDRAAQTASFHQQWDLTQVRIIVLDGSDVGWLQTVSQDDELFVAQMFVDRPFQRRGIGTEVVKRLIGEAASVNQTMRLNVVKINPAVRLYERLGFQVIGEDDRKFYMKRDSVPHLSN